MTHQLIAFHSSGRIIDIKDAKNGLACDCACLVCGDRLLAKQGDVNAWHFAHDSEMSAQVAAFTHNEWMLSRHYEWWFSIEYAPDELRCAAGVSLKEVKPESLFQLSAEELSCRAIH